MTKSTLIAFLLVSAVFVRGTARADNRSDFDKLCRTGADLMVGQTLGPKPPPANSGAADPEPVPPNTVKLISFVDTVAERLDGLAVVCRGTFEGEISIGYRVRRFEPPTITPEIIGVASKFFSRERDAEVLLRLVRKEISDPYGNPWIALPENMLLGQLLSHQYFKSSVSVEHYEQRVTIQYSVLGGAGNEHITDDGSNGLSWSLFMASQGRSSAAEAKAIAQEKDFLYEVIRLYIARHGDEVEALRQRRLKQEAEQKAIADRAKQEQERRQSEQADLSHSVPAPQIAPAQPNSQAPRMGGRAPTDFGQDLTTPKEKTRSGEIQRSSLQLCCERAARAQGQYGNGAACYTSVCIKYVRIQKDGRRCSASGEVFDAYREALWQTCRIDR